MTHDTTSPAPKTFCVWADSQRRVYQEVKAHSPEEAYRLAMEHPECWAFCAEHEDNGYVLSTEVRDIETGEYATVDEVKHCTACGSEIVATVNDGYFGDGECGGCEHRRYQAGSDSPASVPPVGGGRDEVPPNGPWTVERWASARTDSRWAAERWAAGMRERFGRYPTLHAEDKIRLAMDVLWDVVETWDHDTLLHYPEELPSFDEYLAEIGSKVYAIRWSRPGSSPADAHGNAA